MCPGCSPISTLTGSGILGGLHGPVIESHVGSLPRGDEGHIGHAQGCLRGRRRCGCSRRRHLCHGSRGAPVRNRQAMPVLRNGWFSFRWTQIFEAGGIPASETVLRARPGNDSAAPAFAPAPIDESWRRSPASARTRSSRRTWRPHPGSSCRTTTCARWRTRSTPWAVSSCRQHRFRRDVGRYAAFGGRRASQCTAKRWSGSPCAGLVMLGAEAAGRMEPASNTSFSCESLPMASGHGELRGRRPHLPHDHADRRAQDVPRLHKRDRGVWFRTCRAPSGSWGTGSVRCLRNEGSRASRRRDSRRPGSWSATPAIRRCRTAADSPRRAFRSRPECL